MISLIQVSFSSNFIFSKSAPNSAKSLSHDFASLLLGDTFMNFTAKDPNKFVNAVKASLSRPFFLCCWIRGSGHSRCITEVNNVRIKSAWEFKPRRMGSDNDSPLSFWPKRSDISFRARVDNIVALRRSK